MMVIHSYIISIWYIKANFVYYYLIQMCPMLIKLQSIYVIYYSIGLIAILRLVGCGNGSETKDVSQGDPSSIQWMSLEEAELKMKDTPKEIFVMVYADWCPHCKKFDKTTHSD